MTLKEFLAERKRIVNASTPGPWTAYENPGRPFAWVRTPSDPIAIEVHGIDQIANSVAIAGARNRMETLLRIIEVQDAALEYLEAILHLNASGQQQYGGAHTPLDEFQSLHNKAAAARAQVAELLSSTKEQEKE